jgi:Sulfotransferase domain
MQVQRIEIAGRPAVEFEVAERAGDDLYFVLGVRKCGSSLMNSMVNSLANINKRKYLDVGGSFFKEGVPEREWRDNPELLKLLSPGNLYGGFRAMPLAFADAPAYRSAKKILMVRDPRDALVSEYYSIAYSHSLPKETAANTDGAREEFLAARQAALASAIADFVLNRAAAINQTMMEYEDASRDPHTRVFLYEDVILNKRAWLAAMAEHFGWDGGAPGFIEGMMSWADKVPTSENPQAFVRKVVPGDHKEKLPASVIDQLNEKLAPAMGLFGYQ